MVVNVPFEEGDLCQLQCAGQIVRIDEEHQGLTDSYSLIVQFLSLEFSSSNETINTYTISNQLPMSDIQQLTRVNQLRIPIAFNSQQNVKCYQYDRIDERLKTIAGIKLFHQLFKLSILTLRRIELPTDFSLSEYIHTRICRLVHKQGLFVYKSQRHYIYRSVLVHTHQILLEGFQITQISNIRMILQFFRCNVNF